MTKFSARLQEPGWKNQDLRKQPRPPSHMNTLKMFQSNIIRGKARSWKLGHPGQLAHVKRPLANKDCKQHSRSRGQLFKLSTRSLLSQL